MMALSHFLLWKKERKKKKKKKKKNLSCLSTEDNAHCTISFMLFDVGPNKQRPVLVLLLIGNTTMLMDGGQRRGFPSR
jgi:hypothetical protein